MRTDDWGEIIEFTYEEIAIGSFILAVIGGLLMYVYILFSRGYFDIPTYYSIALNLPSGTLSAQINSNQIYLILIGIAIIAFWMWEGIVSGHGYCPAPLCGSGVDGPTDNLFKCALLFFWIEWVMSNFSNSPWLVIPAWAIILGLIYIRYAFGWWS